MTNDDMFEKLILEGMIEVSAVDKETGEFLYSFTPKIKDKYPFIYEDLQNHVAKEAMYLWEGGYITMDITEANPLIGLTEKAFNEIEVAKLDSTLQYSLNEFKRLLKID